MHIKHPGNNNVNAHFLYVDKTFCFSLGQVYWTKVNKNINMFWKTFNAIASLSIEVDSQSLIFQNTHYFKINLNNISIYSSCLTRRNELLMVSGFYFIILWIINGIILSKGPISRSSTTSCSWWRWRCSSPSSSCSPATSPSSWSSSGPHLIFSGGVLQISWLLMNSP